MISFNFQTELKLELLCFLLISLESSEKQQNDLNEL